MARTAPIKSPRSPQPKHTGIKKQIAFRASEIAYVADAVVKHSHRYTLRQEFRRYFDTGYTWKENHDLISFVEKAEGRGKDFFVNLMKRLLKEEPYLTPYAVLNTFVKWCGYRMGWMSTHAPIWLKKKLSGQDFYWTSKDFLEKSKMNPDVC